jgi:response regulator RpfG family c-di-GMP phosphodiesterase
MKRTEILDNLKKMKPKTKAHYIVYLAISDKQNKNQLIFPHLYYGQRGSIRVFDYTHKIIPILKELKLKYRIVYNSPKKDKYSRMIKIITKIE